MKKDEETIGLNRSDQLQALARDPHANLVLGEIIKRIGKRLRAEDRVATAAFDEIWILIANVPNEAVVTTVATAFREALYVPIHIPLQNSQTLTAQLQPIMVRRLTGGICAKTWFWRWARRARGASATPPLPTPGGSSLNCLKSGCVP